MKIVVVGGAGLIGAQTVEILRKRGHDVVAASPRFGVNAVTGEGLQQALEGAEVVVDVSNSPNWEDSAVMEFFDKSTRNLLAAGEKAGVKHHIALSVVGTDGLQESGYFRAKLAQEKLIEGGKVPYTIVRATQFFEFLGQIAEHGAEDQTVKLPSANLQPIASADVAEAMAETALAAPANAIVDVAGPDKARFIDLIGKYLKANNDSRQVVASDDMKYFGVALKDDSLCPLGKAKLGATRLEDWMRKAAMSV